MMDFQRIDRAMLDRAQPSGPSSADRPDQCWRVVGRQMDRIEALRDKPEEAEPLAMALTYLAEALEELVLHEAARNAWLECLEVCRSDETNLASLRRSTLAALRKNLIVLKRFDDALTIAQRQVRHDKSGDARHAITTILTTLGRDEEALASAAECVKETRARNDVMDTARALDDYARRLDAAGRHEEALRATQEAAGLWRTRRSDNPYVVVLALDTLIARLGKAGRLDEAAAVGAELATSWKGDALTSWNLGETLCNAGNTLLRLGLFREALAAYETSLACYRQRTRDERAERDMGLVLRNLGSLLRTLERFDEALARNAEAVELASWAVLSGHPGEGIQLEFGHLMNQRACILEALGRPEEAATAAAEAIRRYSDPRDIAMARITSCVCLSSAGRHSEALSESMTALELLERVFDDELRAFGWHDHALVRSRRGEHAEALSASAEAVRRFRDLEPVRHAVEIAEAVLRFAEVRFTAAEDLDAAREAAADAAGRFERLAGRTPGAFDARLERARTLARRP